MSDKAESIQHQQYSLPTEYSKNVAAMNEGSKYPSWNSRADSQAKYPDAAMQGAKVRKQVMK